MTLMLEDNLTPEEGYRRAEFQRPGVRIIMGPTQSREEKIAQVNAWVIFAGPQTWRQYDLMLKYRKGG